MYRLYYVLNYIFQDRQVTGEKTAQSCNCISTHTSAVLEKKFGVLTIVMKMAFNQ